MPDSHRRSRITGSGVHGLSLSTAVLPMVYRSANLRPVTYTDGALSGISVNNPGWSRTSNPPQPGRRVVSGTGTTVACMRCACVCILPCMLRDRAMFFQDHPAWRLHNAPLFRCLPTCKTTVTAGKTRAEGRNCTGSAYSRSRQLGRYSGATLPLACPNAASACRPTTGPGASVRKPGGCGDRS